ASGGSHLLLGERDGMLCDPYYPKYATLRPQFVPQLHAYYDFVVRYEEWLVAPDVSDWEAEVGLAGARGSTRPEAGAVWIITRRKPGFRIVHLVNLTDQGDTAWNALRTPPASLPALELALGIQAEAVQHAWLLSPDAALGRPTPLDSGTDGTSLRLQVPGL